MRGHVQWPPFFSVFWDKYGLFLVGSATLFFDFFFAVITIALIITTIYKRLKRKLFGAHPSLLIGHISVRLKFFPPIIQQGILQEVEGGLAVPQWGRPSGGLASARPWTTTLGFKELFSASALSEVNPPTPCLWNKPRNISENPRQTNKKKGCTTVRMCRQIFSPAMNIP